jgi:hypothetical protein
MQTIASFERANITWQGSSMNLQNANQKCKQTIAAIEKSPLATSTATLMNKFWVSFETFQQYTDNLTIELRILRAWTMEVTFKINNWLSSLTHDAVHVKTGKGNWCRKLADVIYGELKKKKRLSTEIILNSAHFLPKVTQSNFRARLPRFTYDSNVNEQHTITLTSAAIRQWLGFPNENIDLIRGALIDILMGRKYDAILHLDETWHMFLYPYASLMQGADASQRKSPTFVQNILDTFKTHWLSHPIFKKTSELHAEFQYLQHLIDEWKNKDEGSFNAVGSETNLSNTYRDVQLSLILNNTVCFTILCTKDINLLN